MSAMLISHSVAERIANKRISEPMKIRKKLIPKIEIGNIKCLPVKMSLSPPELGPQHRIEWVGTFRRQIFE